MVRGFSIVVLAAVDLKSLHLKGSLLNESNRTKQKKKKKSETKLFQGSGIFTMRFL